MKEIDKELLIKDLSARLPYGVKVDIPSDYPFNPPILEGIRYDGEIIVDKIRAYDFGYYKPYLRPMSSMTEEEKKEVSTLLNYEFYIDDDYALVAEDERHRVRLDLIQVYTDWLNAHHFDYRIVPSTEKSMIESELALEAPIDMYKTK